MPELSFHGEWCVTLPRGTGRLPSFFSLPTDLGGFELPTQVRGKPIVGQKEFYMSGQDVFRIDSAGRVMRHESAWDQSPEVGPAENAQNITGWHGIQLNNRGFDMC